MNELINIFIKKIVPMYSDCSYSYQHNFCLRMTEINLGNLFTNFSDTEIFLLSTIINFTPTKFHIKLRWKFLRWMFLRLPIVTSCFNSLKDALKISLYFSDLSTKLSTSIFPEIFCDFHHIWLTVLKTKTIRYTMYHYIKVGRGVIWQK